MSGHTKWADIKRAKGAPEYDPLRVTLDEADDVACVEPGCASLAAHTVIDPATATADDLCWVHTVKRLGVDPTRYSDVAV